MFTTLMMIFGPALGGWLLYWASGKCKGKNAKSFFKNAAWGLWLLYLVFIPGPFLIPFVGPVLNLIVKLAPSVICFIIAVNSILKEMRAQKNGEFTEAA